MAGSKEGKDRASILHPLPIEHPQWLMCFTRGLCDVIDPYWPPPVQHLSVNGATLITDAVQEGFGASGYYIGE
ncbi:hypothetical protein EYF80_041473 [Liparis tanakae]|uniref:Uncharacterized protein n=1 Tax=Liparis tanakae TaxID=230148 RepID=A0A4Z2G500_9TELE|nr:hypothetical protein EYF80_041473 [Liparis tanakae]